MVMVTVGTTPVVTAVTMATMNGALPEHSERKECVSVCVCHESRMVGGAWAGRERAHLRVRRRFCRSERSSEPSGEARTNPCDWQGCTLSSAHPLRFARPEGAMKMRIASSARVNAHVSSQTRAQTVQHRTRIAGIGGARHGVVESKCGTPGSSNCRGARGG